MHIRNPSDILGSKFGIDYQSLSNHISTTEQIIVTKQGVGQVKRAPLLVIIIGPSQKMFALPGNGLNLKVFSFTERVVGYQPGVIESV